MRALQCQIVSGNAALHLGYVTSEASQMSCAALALTWT